MPRVTRLTPEIAEAICRDLADGESLLQICKKKGMPPRSSVMDWLVKGDAGQAKYKEFAEQYRLAREANGHAHADKIVDLSHEVMSGIANPQAVKVAIDGLKWAAERMAPRHYAPRVAGTGKDGAFVVQLSKDDATLL